MQIFAVMMSEVQLAHSSDWFKLLLLCEKAPAAIESINAVYCKLVRNRNIFVVLNVHPN